MRKLSIASIVLPILFIIYSFGFPQHDNNYKGGGELPVTYNDLFAGSGTCLLCHNAQVNQAGESISIISDWRSGMMANAAKDPFWRAKVSHEGLVNPGHKEALEDVCTRCHAPAGNKNAHYLGQPLYSISEMQDDPLAMDGVQCTVCHQIPEASLGSFSGTFEIGDQKIIYGPYEDPFTNPMINNIGYTPQYSQHIKNSSVCGSCHTLLTNSVDNNGQPSGNEFVEQSIYQEWENSIYPGGDVHCATCHVPSIDDMVKISSMPPWLGERTPFGLHHFQGANVLIENILKEHAVELGIAATDIQIDSSLARNYRSLQMNTLQTELLEIDRTEDTLFVDLEMINMSGHKFPGGYPSRRFFVELIVLDNNDQIIFHNGAMDDDYQIMDEDATYEPHYSIINSADQVQIYEMVMGDVNHEVTTVLERANFHLKDNRIPPAGFTTTHFAYDTVAIVGNAFTDANFNKINNIEGSGSDLLHFHIPLNGYLQKLHIRVKLHYQTVSSRWLEEMFSHSSTEIDAFKGYYEDADKRPVLVANDSISSMAINIPENKSLDLGIFPNPAREYINISVKYPGIIRMTDLQGKVVVQKHILDTMRIQVSGLEGGVYFLTYTQGKQKSSRKIIVCKD